MAVFSAGRLRCRHMHDEPRTPPHALPGDRPVWPRDRVVDVAHSKIEVSLDVPARAVSGTVTHTVALLNDGTASVAFDAVAMQVSSVAVARRPAPFEYDGRTLRIEIGEGRKRGQEFAVAITYAATPQLGMYFVGPDDGYPDKPQQVWTQCQDEDTRYWLPCFDHPSEKFTSEMIVTVPGSWYALSNGRLLQDKKNRDGTRTMHWHQDRPHPTYLLTLAAGEFARIEAPAGRVPVDYFVEPKDVATAEKTFANTPAMVALFEKLTGMPYPWSKYSQVVVRDFIFGGMENTSATTMTENILVDPKAARDFTSDPLISHELAHQWFGDLLTCRDWSPWLVERGLCHLPRNALGRGAHRHRPVPPGRDREHGVVHRGAVPPAYRHQRVQRTHRPVRPAPLREGLAGAAHAARRAGGRPVLPISAALCAGQPGAQRHHPGPRERDRGRNGEEPRLVLRPVGLPARPPQAQGQLDMG